MHRQCAAARERKHPHQEFLQIDTRNILFIYGGAFDGLEQALESRANAGAARLGFLTGARNTASLRGGAHAVTPDDLLEFGFIPEYDLPSMTGATHCVVDGDSIEGSCPPTLYGPGGSELALPTASVRKSA